MPSIFDDPEDSSEINDALREERERMYGNFWNPEREESHHRERLRKDIIHGPDGEIGWDDFIKNKDKPRIDKLNISDLFSEVGEKCPLLQQPKNAKTFFYCQGRSDVSVKRAIKSRDDSAYTSVFPKHFSAELDGALASNRLAEICTNPKSFCKCKHYKDHKKREND